MPEVIHITCNMNVCDLWPLGFRYACILGKILTLMLQLLHIIQFFRLPPYSLLAFCQFIYITLLLSDGHDIWPGKLKCPTTDCYNCLCNTCVLYHGDMLYCLSQLFHTSLSRYNSYHDVYVANL